MSKVVSEVSPKRHKAYVTILVLAFFAAALSMLAYLVPFSSVYIQHMKYNPSNRFYPIRGDRGEKVTYNGFDYLKYPLEVGAPSCTGILISFVFSALAIVTAILPLFFFRTKEIAKKNVINYVTLASIVCSLASTLICLITILLQVFNVLNVEVLCRLRDHVECTTQCYWVWGYVGTIAVLPLALAALICFLLQYRGAGSAAGAEEEGGAVLAEIPEIAFLEYGEKKLNFIASTARENMSKAGLIIGPVTGFASQRAKRIGNIKGRLTVWETGHPDTIFKEKVFTAQRVAGMNYITSKGSDGTYYSTYIDVVIPGLGINRIQVDVAKVPSPSEIQSGKAGSLVPLPVVTGWKNGGEISDAPICPAGFSPVTKGTVSAVILNYKTKLAECGLDPNLIGNVEYLRAKPWIFNSVEETSPLKDEEGVDKSVAYDMCAIMNTLKAQKKK